MKYLKSTLKDATQEIKSPEKNVFMFVALLIVGLVVGYIGFALGGILGIVVILFSYGCILAGVMQFIGVSECVCPDCETKGYIFKYAKKYKCKKCKTTSVVVEEKVNS